MVDEDQNSFAFKIEDCRYSSSQEELLAHDEIAREDEKFSGDDDSPEFEDSGVSRRKIDGEEEFWERIEDELVDGDAELEEEEILGFRGERLGETSGTKCEGLSDEEREIEPELKRCKVSTVVDCGGKMVMEGEDDCEEYVMFEGDDLKVEKASSEFLEKLDCESGGDDGDVRIEVGEIAVEEEDDMKKLEFGVDNEVIIVEDGEEEGDVGEERGGGERSGNVECDKRQGSREGDGASMREERRRRRVLPRSLFGLVWREGSWGRDKGVGNQNDEEKVLCGEGSGDANRNVEEEEEEEEEEEVLCGDEGNGDANQNVEEKEEEEEEEEEVSFGEGIGDANRNEVIGIDRVENGLEEASVGRNKEGSCEEGTMRIILGVLRLLAKEESINDGGKVDFIETLMRRGLTFPRSRFLPEEVEDDDGD